jgi:hypothetical protein
MRTLDNIVSDRGSKYAVSGAPCRSAEEARALVDQLKTIKKFAKATHNTWGLLCAAGPIKHDDGESGAGMVILRMLEREGCAITWSWSPAGMAASIWAATASAMCRRRYLSRQSGMNAPDPNAAWPVVPCRPMKEFP